MLGVLANNHYFAFSLDDLALFADLLNGWFHLHCLYHTFLALNFGSTLRISQILFCTPGNASLGQVVDRNLDGYTITGQNFDIIHPKLTGDMGCYHMSVWKLHLEACVGQCLNNYAFKFDDVILLCQNNPSYLFSFVTQKPFSTSVRTITPSLVSATVFS